MRETSEALTSLSTSMSSLSLIVVAGRAVRGSSREALRAEPRKAAAAAAATTTSPRAEQPQPPPSPSSARLRRLLLLFQHQRHTHLVLHVTAEPRTVHSLSRLPLGSPKSLLGNGVRSLIRIAASSRVLGLRSPEAFTGTACPLRSQSAQCPCSA